MISKSGTPVLIVDHPRPPNSDNILPSPTMGPVCPTTKLAPNVHSIPYYQEEATDQYLERGFTILNSNLSTIHNGVAFIIKDSFLKFISNFIPFNDRIASITLNSKGKKIHLINIYEPVKPSEYPSFISSLTSHLKQINPNHFIIIGGDFNIKIGNENIDYIVGHAALNQITNNNGKLIIEICNKFNLKIINTFFKQKNNNYFTFFKYNSPYKSQLDFFITSRKMSSFIRNFSILNDFDFLSDHRPIFLNLFIKPYLLKNLNKFKINQPSPSIKKSSSVNNLAIPSLATKFHNDLKSIPTDNSWQSIQNTIIKSANSHLNIKTIYPDWISPHTTQLILSLPAKNKRKLKKNASIKLKLNQIKKSIKKDKRNYISSKLNLISDFKRSNNLYDVFKTLKFITSSNEKKNS
ncbi:craniofacial development protein 2-like [Gordionus sp. m RMFG-2023]|uniref:craniofacial development protein 2-like n=1 Tax=Gordionus sp. m RMFG-2023 TaxID=3053472 RepID=UPI0031FC3DF8